METPQIIDKNVLIRIASASVKRAQDAHGSNPDLSSIAKRMGCGLHGYLVDKLPYLADAATKAKTEEMQKQLDYRERKIAIQAKTIRDLVAKLRDAGLI